MRFWSREEKLKRLLKDLYGLAEDNRKWAKSPMGPKYDGDASYGEIVHEGKAIAYRRAAEWLEEILRQ